MLARKSWGHIMWTGAALVWGGVSIYMYLFVSAAQVPPETASIYHAREEFTQESSMPIVSIPEDMPYSLLFVGDIMMDRGIRNIVEAHAPGDYLFPFVRSRDMLSSSDIIFGNLEGPISDGGSRKGSMYSFRMDPRVADALRAVGFDVVSFANNHVGDYGIEAFEDTIDILDGVGIAYVGAGRNRDDAMRARIIEHNGNRIGFLGFSDVGPSWMEAHDETPGILLASPQLVTDTVRQEKGNTDILIVSFHFGDEYHARSNTRQQELARAAIDAGATIVVGHHPHVAEEIEAYNGGVIVYSLGNFIFDQAFSPETKEALAVRFDMKRKDIIKVTPLTLRFTDYFQPYNDNVTPY